jgi:hypothetical protein
MQDIVCVRVRVCRATPPPTPTEKGIHIQAGRKAHARIDVCKGSKALHGPAAPSWTEGGEGREGVECHRPYQLLSHRCMTHPHQNWFPALPLEAAPAYQGPW